MLGEWSQLYPWLGKGGRRDRQKFRTTASWLLACCSVGAGNRTVHTRRDGWDRLDLWCTVYTFWIAVARRLCTFRRPYTVWRDGRALCTFGVGMGIEEVHLLLSSTPVLAPQPFKPGAARSTIIRRWVVEVEEGRQIVQTNGSHGRGLPRYGGICTVIIAIGLLHLCMRLRPKRIAFVE